MTMRGRCDSQSTYSCIAKVLRTLPKVWSSLTISNVAHPGDSLVLSFHQMPLAPVLLLLGVLVWLERGRLTMETFSLRTRVWGPLWIDAKDRLRGRVWVPFEPSIFVLEPLMLLSPSQTNWLSGFDFDFFRLWAFTWQYQQVRLLHLTLLCSEI